jgi:hypothetical protein
MKRHDESISDRLRRMAATDELKVGRGRAEQIATRALARAEARPRQRARLVAAIVSGSAFAIVSVTGVGAIADQAVPGDSLYAVDRAYESISRVMGRDVDRTQERLEEALALVQRGDREAAASHVNTELGQRIPVLPLPDAINEANPVETTAVMPEDDSATDAAAAVAVEASPTTAPETASVAAEEAPQIEADADETSGDPFVLALENALRATQAAAGTDDELIAAEADEAVRSVVKLAAGATEEVSGASSERLAPEALSVPEDTTTTTTTPERGNSEAAPGNSTSSTTTTSVPNDSEEVPPGDGDTVGDDSGGSQEGSGSAGEPGDTGDEPPGPVILPIP